MNNRTFSAFLQVGMAVVLAATTACGDNGTGPDPDPGPVAPHIVITQPSGEHANETVSPETPVTLTARVNVFDRATYTADDVEVLWFEIVEGFGERPLEQAGRTVEKQFGVGTWQVFALARERGNNQNFSADTLTFTIRPDGGEVTGFQPADGTTVEQGAVLSCGADVELDPPRGYTLIRQWQFGEGNTVECDEVAGEQQLVSPAASANPATATLPLGTHTLTFTARAAGRDLTLTTMATIRVVEPPPRIVFTDRVSAGERDFYTVRIGRPETLTRLTHTGGIKFWPSISPDGTTLAYTARGNCTSTLWLANLDGSNAREITGPATDGSCPALTARAPRWSPDGRQLTFVGARNTFGEFGIFTVNADGSQFRLFDVRGVTPYSVFHPNGQEILYAYSDRRELDRSPWSEARTIVVREQLATGERTQLFVGFWHVTEAEDRLNPGPYDISPDGRWLAARTFNTGQVMLIRTDGSGEYRFITPPKDSAEWYDPHRPIFCGDSEWVYYVVFQNGRNTTLLRKVRVDGARDQQVMALAPHGISTIKTPWCAPS